MTAVKMLAAKGYIKLEHYFVDGTKIESASGRYTFVWKRAEETNNKKLDEKLRAYIRMADEAWEEENGEYGNKDLEELGGKEGHASADVKELAGILRERMDDEERKKKLKKVLKTVREGLFAQEKEV